jgi:hypothetical protein
MRWLYLMSSDELDSEVFFTEDADGRRVLRSLYQDLACTKCGKFDEISALNRGIDADLRINLENGSDFGATSDYVNVISRRFQSVLDELHVEGIRFVPCGDHGESIVVPMSVAATDIARCKMDFRGRRPCAVCARYSITCFSPSVSAMTLPSKSMTLCVPSQRPETKSVSMLLLIMSEELATELRGRRLAGINWDEADRTY